MRLQHLFFAMLTLSLCACVVVDSETLYVPSLAVTADGVVIPGRGNDWEAFFQSLREDGHFVNLAAMPLSRPTSVDFSDCVSGTSKLHRVRLKYDVDAQGRVVNARVLGTTNSCLNLPAVQIVRSWNYSPRVVDGFPVSQLGLVTSLEFSWREEK